MNHRKQRLLLFVIAATIALATLFILLKPGADKNANINDITPEETEQIESTTPYYGDLSSVNLEEKNIISKKAGLPYESNEYAIAFRLDDVAPSGIILIVIDKTAGPTIPERIRDEALRYLRDRGINPDELKIEYKKAKNV